MPNTSGANSKGLKTIAMIINTLEEHEQIIDKSIDHLALLTEKIVDLTVLINRLIEIEQKLDCLQKDIRNVNAAFHHNKK
jgi:hypothetical protein